MIQLIKNILTVTALSTIAIGASAQDLLANRAPSDHRLSDLKTIKLNSAPKAIDLNNPASDIYSTWDDKATSIAPGVLPPNFKVDLRGFAMPTPSRKITSKFGPRWGRKHQGLDIKVYTGDTIYAAFDGKVRIKKYNASGWGYYIVIRHPNGLETLYGHLSKQLVEENQIVRAGEPIGLGGNTGRSTGSHLHFETRLLGQAINPAFMFDFEKQDVVGDFYVVKSGEIQNSHKSATASALAANTKDKEESAANKTEHKTQASAKEEDKKEEATEKSSRHHHRSSSKDADKDNDKKSSDKNKKDKEKQVASNSSKSSSKSRKKDTTYTVKDGDNMYNIAAKNGIPLNKLLRMNGMSTKGNPVIQKGMKIKLQ